MIQGNVEMTNNGVIEKFCYNNIEDSCDSFGGLYQWDEMMQYTTQKRTQGICPPGWHIPSDDEWKILEGAVDSWFNIGDPVWDQSEGRGYDAGKNLKTTTGWSLLGNGIDLFGFSGQPGGVNEFNGSGFMGLTVYGDWWTSTEINNNYGWFRDIDRQFNYVGRYSEIWGFKKNGFSVRCLKDQ